MCQWLIIWSILKSKEVTYGWPLNKEAKERMLKPNYLAQGMKISALFDIVSRGERLQDAAKLS